MPAGMLPRFATPLLAGPTPLLTVDHCAVQAAGVAEVPSKLKHLMQALRWCCVQSWRLLGQAQTAALLPPTVHQKSSKHTHTKHWHIMCMWARTTMLTNSRPRFWPALSQD